MKPTKVLLVIFALLLTVADSAAAQSRICSSQMATTISFRSQRPHEFLPAVPDVKADTAHFALIDTNASGQIDFSWWPSSVGADIFISPGLYALHLRSGFGHPLALDATLDPANWGIEIRVHPIFVDYVLGFGPYDDIPFHSPPYPQENLYYTTTIYGGVILNKYRVGQGC